MYVLRKLKKEATAERLAEKSIRLGEEMEKTPFGIKVLAKLDEIADSQNVFNHSLLHMLRTDLLQVTDEIMYIHRKRNTKASKWSSVNERLKRFQVLEEVMDNCYTSYKKLGGNCFIEDRYKEAKAVIVETLKQPEE